MDEEGGAIELMLAQNYNPEKHCPTGWLMSEKLDGVRCYWNGSQMYSRQGKVFFPPDFFKDTLPEGLALDGELWTERDDFQKCLSIVRRQDYTKAWSSVKYMVYDAPLLDDIPFSQRLDKIKSHLE